MTTLLELLRRRRLALGISYPDLAARSGVSVATVKRIFSGRLNSVKHGHVEAVAEAMGLSLSMRQVYAADNYVEKAARQQAERLVRMVQGTSALESQAIDAKDAERLTRESVHRLRAGSRKRVWAQ